MVLQDFCADKRGIVWYTCYDLLMRQGDFKVLVSLASGEHQQVDHHSLCFQEWVFIKFCLRIWLAVDQWKRVESPLKVLTIAFRIAFGDV